MKRVSYSDRANTMLRIVASGEREDLPSEKVQSHHASDMMDRVQAVVCLAESRSRRHDG